MEKQISQISAVTNLAKAMSSKNVENLIEILNPPKHLFQKVNDGIEFLSALEKWEDRDPQVILTAIKDIRPDLVSIAQKINWLKTNPKSSIIKLIRILKIEPSEWLMMGTIIPGIKSDDKLESKLNILDREGYITRDLGALVNLMHAIKRDDIIVEILDHKSSFDSMGNQQFNACFRKEVANLSIDLGTWINNLRKYVKVKNDKVKQFLDDDEDVSIESVFIPLTIIKEKPQEVDVNEETTYSEIAILRKIAESNIDIDPVDFSQELKYASTAKSEIWCVLGNPGCGKTFLCHKTANDFWNRRLPQFSYILVIPCRNEDWHQMEKSKKKPIDSDFIQDWLRLSMPASEEWAADLSSHIYETDGHGLLLIIDSMDEYTKEVLFEKTLLFLLLNRKCLSHSVILLTSRPGAYTLISSSHSLKIDRFFQVLGFSPQNRDEYFKNQLREKGKLEQLNKLFHDEINQFHDEINQLSLVPVNASLFAALIRGSDDVTAHTLTHLYSELSVYLIRRQLSRMGNKELAKKSTLIKLKENVLDCLVSIGEEAYRGVYTRELTFSREIQLTVGKVKKSCDCLGLAMEHIKKDHLGGITRVWSFVHLTMQEFVGAYWLSAASWKDQCLSTRYIVHSVGNFSLFRMVLRFICGLLAENSLRILTILYKYSLKSPFPIDNMPMFHQFNCKYSSLPCHMGWTAFSQKFLQISEILHESKSAYSIPAFEISDQLYFYFDEPVAITPNEWLSFLQTLERLEHTINLIFFSADRITPKQFKDLLAKIETNKISLRNLAIQFPTETGKCDSNLFDYATVIRESQVHSNTKISMELLKLTLSPEQTEATQIEKMDTGSISCIFQLYPGNNLLRNERFAPHCLDKIVKYDYFHSAQYLLISHHDSCKYNTLFSHLDNVTQLSALHLYGIPTKFKDTIKTQVRRLKNLQELTLMGGEINSILRNVSTLSHLKHLALSSSEPSATIHGAKLMNLLNKNNGTLCSVHLSDLNLTEKISLNEMFTILSSCSNLVQIQLIKCSFQPGEKTGELLKRLDSLLFLCLSGVELGDSVFLSLCTGLLCHPNIRYLEVDDVNLSSNSKDVIIKLIPTLSQIKNISFNQEQILKTDPYTKVEQREAANK